MIKRVLAPGITGRAPRMQERSFPRLRRRRRAETPSRRRDSRRAKLTPTHRVSSRERTGRLRRWAQTRGSETPLARRRRSAASPNIASLRRAIRPGAGLPGGAGPWGDDVRFAPARRISCRTRLRKYLVSVGTGFTYIAARQSQFPPDAVFNPRCTFSYAGEREGSGTGTTGRTSTDR